MPKYFPRNAGTLGPSDNDDDDDDVDADDDDYDDEYVDDYGDDDDDDAEDDDDVDDDDLITVLLTRRGRSPSPSTRPRRKMASVSEKLS